MIPDHARALRAAATLATAGAIPASALTVAMAAERSWLAFGLSLAATLCIVGVAFRCAAAFDRLRRRYRYGGGVIGGDLRRR